MLKLKTQLDIVKYSLWVQKFFLNAKAIIERALR